MATPPSKDNKQDKQISTPEEAAIAALSPLPEPRTSFLDLPGELRNRIYRRHLLQEEAIDVSKGLFSEAPLLLVCREIRAESISIFYLENEWNIYCPDWDYSIYKGFFDHLRVRRGITITLDTKTCWENSGSYKNKAGLLNFIKMLHENKEVRGIRWIKESSGMTAAAMGAFEIAEHMGSQSWPDIERVLGVYLLRDSEEEERMGVGMRFSCISTARQVNG